MRSVKFPFTAPNEGLHEVKVSFVASGNRAGKVRYEIEDEIGNNKLFVDQRKKGSKDSIWHSLGSFIFKKGHKYAVTLHNQDTEGFVIADAAQIIPLNP